MEVDALGLAPADLLGWLREGGSEPLPWPFRAAILGDPPEALEVARACLQALPGRPGEGRVVDLLEADVLEELERSLSESPVILCGPPERLVPLLSARPELGRRLPFRVRLAVKRVE